MRPEPRRCVGLPDAPPSRSRVVGVFAVVLLAAFQVHSAYGFWRYLDLHPWDECAYLHQARLLGQGEPMWDQLLCWSGLYSAFIALLDAVTPPRQIQDISLAIVTLASTFSLMWALAAFMPSWAAALGALGWASGSILVGYHNGVYLYAIALLLLGVGSFARGHRLAGTALLLAAAATRSELLFVVFGCGAWLWVLARQRVGIVLAAAVLALLAAQIAFDRHERSWVAFRQGYAQGVVERQLAADPPTGAVPEDRTPAHAFEFPDAHVERDFGAATGLAGVIAANPRAFLAHVAGNLAACPRVALEALPLFPAASRELRFALQAMLVALAAVGLVDLACSIRAGARGRSDPRDVWLAALAGGAPGAFVAPVLFSPGSRYLVVLYVPLAALALRGLRAALSPLRSRWAAAGSETVASAGLAAAFALAILATRPIDATPRRWMRWRDLLAAGWALPPGEHLYGRDTVLLSTLFPAGARLVVPEPGERPRGTYALFDVEDLCKLEPGLLSAADGAVIRRMLDDESFHIAHCTGPVLVLTNEEAP